MGHISSGSSARGGLCPQRGQGSPRALVPPGDSGGTSLSLHSEAPGRGPGMSRGTGLRSCPSSSKAPATDPRRSLRLSPRTRGGRSRTVQELMAFAESPLQAASRQRACSQCRSHPQSKRAPHEAGLGVALCLVMSEQHVMGGTQCSMAAQGAGRGQVHAATAPVSCASGSPGAPGTAGGRAVVAGNPLLLRPTWAFLAFTALTL